MRELKTVAAAALASVSTMISVPALAADGPEIRLALIYSPHETKLSAPGYLVSAGQLPKDHKNEGDNYLGFMGEVDFGQVSLGLEYLTGTSDKPAGALDMSPNSPTFNPLTGEESETLTLYAGYNVLKNDIIGELDVTLGYFRMWAQPMISPANWYDGLEVGIKGRRTWDNGFALTYRVGYVPDPSVHGYMEDYNLMKGDYILNYRIGAEMPVYGGFSAIGGYQHTKGMNTATVDGSDAVVKFSGFYIGAMYSF